MVKNITLTVSDYTRMTDWQFLKLEAAQNLKKFKKTFQKMFQKIGRKCNMKIVNYLDVTLNLNDGSYPPYKKYNDETNYLHVTSDHPSSISK